MADNETTADIIAWLRRPREGENAYLTLWRDEIADRLDAAQKREAGDAAKLREALVQAELFVGNIVRHGHQTLVPGDKCTACDGAKELRDMICAALSAPSRNCERFQTKDAAREAFQKLRGHRVWADVSLWDDRDEIEAFLDWLFALGKEGVAK